MIDEPKNAVDQLLSDPSFLMMLAGAAIWFIGVYIWFIGPLFRVTGFALVCFSCATTALKRPVATAWPGMLLGGLVMVIGDYLSWVFVIGPLLYIAGAVMVIFFALPLALQRGELPVLTELQKFIDKQTEGKKKAKPKPKAKSKKAVDAEETKDTSPPEDTGSDNDQ